MKKIGILIATLLSAWAVAPLHATGITNFDSIQNWAGSGSNKAAMVIQWNDGQNPSALAWGYRWNGSATGYDMMSSIAGTWSILANSSGEQLSTGSGTESRLAITIKDYGWGKAVETITFNDGSFSRTRNDWSTGYWEYFNVGGSFSTPPDGDQNTFLGTTNYPGTSTGSNWVSSWSGFDSRELSNGSWDGWSFAANFESAPIGSASNPVNNAPPSPPSIATFGTIGNIPFSGYNTMATPTLAVTAGNTQNSPITYQWRFNGTPISGATNSTYNIGVASAAKAGNYSVTLTNANNLSATSSNIAFTLKPAVTFTIISGNQTLTKDYNAVFTLSSAAIFSSNLTDKPTGSTQTYQWFKNGVTISGATSANYTIPAVTANSSGSYLLRVTTRNGTTVVGTVDSPSWYVTLAGSPVISNNSTANATVGTPFNFMPTVSANAISFALKGTLPNGLSFNATTGSISGTPTRTGNFSVTLTPSNSFGFGLPFSMNITVDNPPLPSIATLIVNGNATATSVSAYNTLSGPVFVVVPNNPASNPPYQGAHALRYQWRRNGIAITGATNATYSIASASSNNTGFYDVILTNALGNTTTSRKVLFELNPAATFTIGGAGNQQVANGANKTFAVNISALPAGANATYQWYKNGVAIGNATSANYTVSGFSSNSVGAYSVQVTSKVGETIVGSAISAPWALTMQDNGVLVYGLGGSASRTVGARQQAGTISGYVVLDRKNDKVAIIETYSLGFYKYNSLELRDDFSVVTTGPVAGSRTAIVGSLNGGGEPVDHDIACITGSDAEVLVASATVTSPILPEVKVFAPNTMTGVLLTLVRESTIEIDTFNVTLTLNKTLTTSTYRNQLTFEQAVNATRATAVAAGFVNEP
jgi:hypothetical protein